MYFYEFLIGVEGRYVSALYSAASQMNQLNDTEKHLRSLLKELLKPKIVDFLETSMVSSMDKAKLLKQVAEESGKQLPKKLRKLRLEDPNTYNLFGLYFQECRRRL